MKISNFIYTPVEIEAENSSDDVVIVQKSVYIRGKYIGNIMIDDWKDRYYLEIPREHSRFWEKFREFHYDAIIDAYHMGASIYHVYSPEFRDGDRLVQWILNHANEIYEIYNRVF